MQIGEIGAIMGTVNNIEEKLNDASGVAVSVELRMRLIGELYEPVRNELINVIQYEITTKNINIREKEYWNCKLYLLERAIEKVFRNKMSLDEQQHLVEFRDMRNALLHANFVDLMELLGISPMGREITAPGKRNELKVSQIREAIISIDRQGGFEKFICKAKQTISILEKLSFSFAK